MNLYHNLACIRWKPYPYYKCCQQTATDIIIIIFNTNEEPYSGFKVFQHLLSAFELLKRKHTK